MLLPTYDVFDESRYFQPGDKQYVYGLGREQLGITVCEDAWNDKTFWANPLYTRDPVSELVAQGTSVLINISASPYIIDKRSLRYEMLRNIALRHNRPIIYVNQVGGDDSLILTAPALPSPHRAKSLPRPRPLKKISSSLTRLPIAAISTTNRSKKLPMLIRHSLPAHAITFANAASARL